MEPITPTNTPPEFNETHGRESLKEMGQNLYSDINQLWMRQSELVKTELNEKISDVKTATGYLGVGGVLLFVGLMALVATCIIALDMFVPLWAASAIVTVVVLMIGGLALISGKKKMEADRLKPKHSIDALGEIKNTFQEKFHEYQKH